MNIVQKSEPNFYEGHDNGISTVIDVNSPREKVVVLWDFDSIIHLTLYAGKDNFGNRNLEYTQHDLEYLKGKLTEMTLKILNNVEEYFDILSCYIFIKGNSNFRKELYPDYKKNRPEPNSLVNDLYKYAIEMHQAIPADNCEAEDMVYQASKQINHEGLILYVDHDLLEIPSKFYNYKTNIFSKLSEKEALWEKYKKLNVGEKGDNANLTPSYGIKNFEKDFHKDMSVEEYEKQSFETFLWCWSDKIKVKKKIQRTPNIEKATEMFNLAKEILWLKNIEN